ncbi:MAG: methylenetetrahydrofolate reductase [NAD(P)H] [Micavibrio aeruginosavorus]|uniref:Methylenetetrahydrofolate reductase n=1 Tax=Micavibrio aeruginosavorus TaxID=349221 RepID=A0A2W5FPQ7_9BACT|nr:MAG: methylenetetrahydrofolate reductase [NAD(P)H] [Micavibrio aeruginosavorus]
MTDLTYSFEFFPPKSEKSAQELLSSVEELSRFSPKFMTVTFGTGGGSRDTTLQTLKNLQRAANGIPFGSHLTYISHTKEELDHYTDILWNQGIRHLVALRGDMPTNLVWPLDPDAEYYQFTSDFVEALLKRHPFDISVGAYPEKHPDAPDMQADLIALKKKCDAGATRAITQLFFDNDVYYRFVDAAQKAGIATPIVPGLLPIRDFQKVCEFASKCQASVPQFLHEKFAGDISDNLAEDLLSAQVEDLAKNGVDHIHFYTLNKSSVLNAVCKNFSKN